MYLLIGLMKDKRSVGIKFFYIFIGIMVSGLNVLTHQRLRDNLVLVIGVTKSELEVLTHPITVLVDAPFLCSAFQQITAQPS